VSAENFLEGASEKRPKIRKNTEKQHYLASFREANGKKTEK